MLRHDVPPVQSDEEVYADAEERPAGPLQALVALTPAAERDVVTNGLQSIILDEGYRSALSVFPSLPSTSLSASSQLHKAG